MTTPGLPIPPKPCLTCAQPTTNKGQRCDTHTQQHNAAHNERTAYYSTTEWRNLRALVRERDQHQCVVCTDTTRLMAHHIHARNNGGADALPNLITLCHSCHSRIEKHDPHTEQALTEHLEQSPHH